MRPLVNLEVLAARENLPAARKQTRKRLLARVNADVVDQLVFGLERSHQSTAALPPAQVRAERRGTGIDVVAAGPRLMHRHRLVDLVRSADVIDADVRHQVVHRVEHPAARRRTGSDVIVGGRRRRGDSFAVQLMMKLRSTQR